MSQNNHAERLRELEEHLPTMGSRTRNALLAGAAALDAVAQMRQFAEAMVEDSSSILHGFAYQVQAILNKHNPEEPNEKD